MQVLYVDGPFYYTHVTRFHLIYSVIKLTVTVGDDDFEREGQLGLARNEILIFICHHISLYLRSDLEPIDNDYYLS